MAGGHTRRNPDNPPPQPQPDAVHDQPQHEPDNAQNAEQYVDPGPLHEEAPVEPQLIDQLDQAEVPDEDHNENPDAPQDYDHENQENHAPAGTSAAIDPTQEQLSALNMFEDEFLSPTENQVPARVSTAPQLPTLSPVDNPVRARDAPRIPTSSRPDVRTARAISNPVFSPLPVDPRPTAPVSRAVTVSNTDPTQDNSGRRIRFNVSNNIQGPQASNKTGNINLTIPFPPKFNPDTDNWLLWKSSVEMFVERLGLDRAILEQQHTDMFTPEEHCTVLGVLTQIAPDTDGLWFTKLGLQWAHQAWEELTRSYGQRTAIAVQQKLLDFDNTAQRPEETIKNWVVRLRREAKEISLMGSELVPHNTHKIKLLRVHPTPGNELLFRNHLASIRTRLHTLTVEQLEEELINFEEGLAAEQQHVPLVMQSTHKMSAMPSASQKGPATFNHVPTWVWRNIKYEDICLRNHGTKPDDFCLICLQARKGLRGCMHATKDCDHLHTDFGKQVRHYLLRNPHLDHEDASKRAPPPPPPQGK